MREHALVARKQLRTSNYSAEMRARLGAAVEAARLAAGYKYRTDFCRAHGIRNLRGLELLEQGKTGVGQVLLFEVADALPGWDRETPRIILEGGPVPPVSPEDPQPPPTPTLRPSLTDEDVELLVEIDTFLKSRGYKPTTKLRLAIFREIMKEQAASDDPPAAGAM